MRGLTFAKRLYKLCRPCPRPAQGEALLKRLLDPYHLGGGGDVERHPPERCRRHWLVANRDTLPQKWPPPPWKVAGSCRWTHGLNQLCAQGEAFLKRLLDPYYQGPVPTIPPPGQAPFLNLKPVGLWDPDFELFRTSGGLRVLGACVAPAAAEDAAPYIYIYIYVYVCIYIYM